MVRTISASDGAPGYAGAMPWQTRHVTRIGERRIAWLEAAPSAESDAHPVVLVHGLGTSDRWWAPTIPVLAERGLGEGHVPHRDQLHRGGVAPRRGRGLADHVPLRTKLVRAGSA